jgi:hypothetical protein
VGIFQTSSFSISMPTSIVQCHMKHGGHPLEFPAPGFNSIRERVSLASTRILQQSFAASMSDRFWDIVQTDQESIWASHGYQQEMFLSISPKVVFWSGNPFLPLSASMQYSTWPFGKVQCSNAMKNRPKSISDGLLPIPPHL